MSSEARHQLHVFFFPYPAPGHMLPLAHIAALFAGRGIRATFVTTPANAPLLHPALAHQPVHILLLPFPSAEVGLPPGCENTASLPHPRTRHQGAINEAAALLHDPLAALIRTHRPDCLISDYVCDWTADLARSLGIPRLVFSPTSLFSTAVWDAVLSHGAHRYDRDNAAAFIVEAGLPHRVELTPAELPLAFAYPAELNAIKESENSSDGTIYNSFYELEPRYVDCLKKCRATKVWCIGPVALASRGAGNDLDSKQGELIKKWLNSKTPGTVVYVCLGSEFVFKAEQLREMALGLEASGHPFVWVVRSDEAETEWMPEGLEERIRERGLIIRGWAPQLMILNHPAVGGFVTHCGWNSTLEAVSAGVPMGAWPLEWEQFFNERLLVEVLGIAVRVLDGVGQRTAGEEKEVVKWERVRGVVERVMGGNVGETRRRAREFGVMARAAVEEGGSSYGELSRLIEELEDLAAQKREGREEGR
ncbi:probable UDP-glucosyl transferase 73B6 [Elaeis guineensis]|uniref:Glycosyltransferase n=1 Tax=Elaeis guineensis var. tenera TaxID=51953 RepID=A0A6I9RUR8_ELAGV|nr:scopoletin glucosyltransferase-like [Elaeis guineensis]